MGSAASHRNHILIYLNGERLELGAEYAGWMLADYLRYRRQLTGTKIVCAEGDCGACSVLRYFPGIGKKNAGRSEGFVPFNSCITTCAQLDGSSLVTVEGLGTPQALHPVQAAMKDCHGSQCGFCTPGFVVALAGLVEKKIENGENEPGTKLSEREAKNATTGNLCRCTGYQPILDAAKAIQPSSCVSVRKAHWNPAQNKELKAALSRPVKLEGENSGGGNRFEFFAPTSLKEASAFLAKNKDARLLAAATDLGVVHNKGKIRLDRIVSLHLVEELYELKQAKGAVRVGARVTLSELRDALAESVPEFSRFLDIFASPQIKNIATLIGNVANASPIADTPPFLLVCEAVVEIFGLKGKRKVALKDFYLGYRKTALRRGELITGISFTIPPEKDTWALYKVSERKDLDISSVNLGIRLEWEKSKGGAIRSAFLAAGGVAATPLRLKKTEALLKGKVPGAELFSQAATMFQSEISPIGDVRGSAAFRRILAENLLKRFFREHLGVSP